MKLGKELSKKIKKLKKERKKYKSAFDNICNFMKLKPKESKEPEIFVFACFSVFNTSEFRSMIDSKIIFIDSQIEELETKFKQL